MGEVQTIHPSRIDLPHSSPFLIRASLHRLHRADNDPSNAHNGGSHEDTENVAPESAPARADGFEEEAPFRFRFLRPICRSAVDFIEQFSFARPRGIAGHGKRVRLETFNFPDEFGRIHRTERDREP